MIALKKGKKLKTKRQFKTSVYTDRDTGTQMSCDTCGHRSSARVQLDVRVAAEPTMATVKEVC